MDFEIVDASIEVTDMETGEQVDRPDIAAKGLGIFAAALEGGGVTLDTDNVVLLRPEGVDPQMPDEAS